MAAPKTESAPKTDLRAAFIQVLKLPSTATDDEILAAAANARAYEEREKKIAAKIAESAGALNRDMAIMTLRQQEAEDAKAAKAAAKK